MTEDEMVGWHHRLNGHGCEQTPGDGEGQGSLVCCSPWGRKELDVTQRLNNNRVSHILVASAWLSWRFQQPQTLSLLPPLYLSGSVS